MDEKDERAIRFAEQIKTLFDRTERLEKIAESVNALAISVKELALGQTSCRPRSRASATMWTA